MRIKKSIREAEEQGDLAFRRGIPSSKNPLAGREAMAWDRGWHAAKREKNITIWTSGNRILVLG